MANPANFGSLIGRVGKGGIKQFPNNDGSSKLMFNLAVDENFLRHGKTEPDTDFVPVQAFIPAKANGALGSWANVHEGDLIALNVRITSKPYTGKDGNVVYPGATIEADGFPKYLEPKSVTSARAAKKATEVPAAEPEAPAAPTAADDKAAEIARLKAQLAAAQADASQMPFGN